MKSGSLRRVTGLVREFGIEAVLKVVGPRGENMLHLACLENNIMVIFCFVLIGLFV